MSDEIEPSDQAERQSDERLANPVRREGWCGRLDWHSWANTLGIVASFGFLVHQCHVNEEQADEQYRIASIQYRPRLIVASQPVLSAYATDEAYLHAESPPALDIEVTGCIRFDLTVQNNGDHEAELLAVHHGYSRAEPPFLLERLFDEQTWDIAHYERFGSTGPTEIPPDSSHTEELTLEMKMHRATPLSYHFLLIYRNEAGFLYYTYCIVRYEIADSLSIPRFVEEFGGNRAEWRASELVQFVATQMHHFVVFEPTWSSPFSREQAEVVEKWLAHPKTVVSADPCAVDGDDYSVNLIYGRAHSENPEPPTPP